ncbi:MAG: dienelactone hydrolase family protein, partial [Acetobacteraceae bacterium]
MPEKIQLKAADGHTLEAYGVANGDPSIGLVVIQEIYGVNAHIRRVCEWFAEATAYAVIAPALFDRVERGAELGYTA